MLQKITEIKNLPNLCQEIHSLLQMQFTGCCKWTLLLSKLWRKYGSLWTFQVLAFFKWKYFRFDRSSHPEVFYNKSCYKNFAKYTGKHASGLQLYLKRNSGTGVFLWILRNFRKTYFTEHLRRLLLNWSTCSSGIRRTIILSIIFFMFWIKICFQRFLTQPYQTFYSWETQDKGRFLHSTYERNRILCTHIPPKFHV